MQGKTALFVLGLGAFVLAACGGDEAATAPQVAGTLVLGVYQPAQDTSGAAIDRYTEEAGRAPAFAWTPMTWMHGDGSYWEFDPAIPGQYRDRHIAPGITWEPSKGFVQKVGADQPDFNWQQVASGRYDAYIKRFAKGAAAYGDPIILRILHEMNGTWYPWGYGVNGNTDAGDYVAAFRHIVTLFRAQGATNVQFVWNPSVLSAERILKYGGTLKKAYPGDNYVDWIALDGYNNKPADWRSFQDVFAPAYEFLTDLTSRPMILFEVGSLEDPDDAAAKGAWIKDAFFTTIPTQFPQVKIAVYFNSRDGSGRNFSFETSPAALAAWQQVVKSPAWQGHL